MSTPLHGPLIDRDFTGIMRFFRRIRQFVHTVRSLHRFSWFTPGIEHQLPRASRMKIPSDPSLACRVPAREEVQFESLKEFPPMAGVRSQPTLGDFLMREGIITQTQLNLALEEQNATLRSIGRILVDKGFITESVRMTFLQQRFGFERARLKETRIEPLLLLLIPKAFAEKHRVVPIGQDDDKNLIVAMEDPSDLTVLDAMKSQLGRGIKPLVASQEEIQAVLNLYNPAPAPQAAQAAGAVFPEAGDRPRSLPLRIFRWTFLPLMMGLPLLFALAVFFFDAFDIQETLQDWVNNGTNWVDLFLYITVSWGVWSIIMFEINALMFGKKKKPQIADEED